MSDVSLVTNYFPTVNEGFIATLGSSIISGASAVPLSLTTGLTNGSIFVGIIEPGAAAQQVFTGTVDTAGGQITGVKWTKGTNIAHTGGVTIVDYITGTYMNMITAGIRKQHNQDGTHGAITATSLVASGAVTASSLAAATLALTGNATVGGSLTVTGSLIPQTASVTSASTITPSAAFYTVTALAVGTTIAAPTGSPVNGQNLVIRIRDNGTGQSLAWNAIYRTVGVTLPTSTVANNLLYVAAVYNSVDTKWDVLSIGRQ